MAKTLDTRDSDFEERFTALLGEKRESSADVNDVVAKIIARVREEGDAALIDLTANLDGLDLSKVGIAITPAEIEAAQAQVDAETVAALELAHARILDHHRRQVPESQSYTDANGVEIGQRWTPVASAGLYVPGGTASYPSSVLMNAVPAKVAGVKRLVMVVPTPKGELSPLVLVAAKLAGVDEIYRVGGAQAVAALAFGTETIRPVATIVGPGNAYVAAAKRQVFGQVGIDVFAGPTESAIIADENADPMTIAVDLTSQAEHGVNSPVWLFTTSETLAQKVAELVPLVAADMPNADVVNQAWRDYGEIIVCDSWFVAIYAGRKLLSHRWARQSDAHR